VQEKAVDTEKAVPEADGYPPVAEQQSPGRFWGFVSKLTGAADRERQAEMDEELEALKESLATLWECDP
jgi:hypothetical protein